jgi:hypothetical protein
MHKKLSSLLSSMADDLRNAGVAPHEKQFAVGLSDLLDAMADGTDHEAIRLLMDVVFDAAVTP